MRNVNNDIRATLSEVRALIGSIPLQVLELPFHYQDFAYTNVIFIQQCCNIYSVPSAYHMYLLQFREYS